MPTTKQWKYLAIALVALVLAWSVVSFLVPSGPRAFFAQRQAAQDIVDKQYSAEVALDNYEWFIEQKHDIEAKRKQIENFRQQEKRFHETYGNDPSDWSRTAETRHNRIHQQLTGAKNLHDQYVEDYNSRSEQAHRAIFKCGLPYEMEEKFWTGDGRPDDKYLDGMENEKPPNDPEDCVQLESITPTQE